MEGETGDEDEGGRDKLFYNPGFHDWVSALER